MKTTRIRAEDDLTQLCQEHSAESEARVGAARPGCCNPPRKTGSSWTRVGCGGGGEKRSDPRTSWGRAGWLADGLDVGCERGVKDSSKD